MLLSMHDESVERAGDFNSSKVELLLEKHYIFCVISKEYSDYTGFLIGQVASNTWNDDITASDMAIYVKPEYRGSRAAISMIKAFEKWAIQLGAKTIYLANATGIEIDRTAEFFQAIGYKKMGVVCRKEV